MSLVTIAVAKGRLQKPTLNLFSNVGIEVPGEAYSSRRLAILNSAGDCRFLFIKPADVPVYVEHGIADCGIVGRDVLMESATDLLQPLTLEIGCCQIVVAQITKTAANNGGILRVATKYPRIAAAHFGLLGVPVEIIPLAGSVELAPMLGLADCIVDLMETGETLRANGLSVVDVIAESKACFVVNGASFHLKSAAINRLIALLDKRVTGEDACSK